MPLPSLPTDWTIEQAAALQAAVQARLDAPGPFILDASGVRSVDTAGLQLLVAAVAVAERSARPWELRAPTAPLLDVAALAGLAEPLGLPATTPQPDADGHA